MSFWYPYLVPQIITYNSNIGVQIIVVLELGTSTKVNGLNMESGGIIAYKRTSHPFNIKT